MADRAVVSMELGCLPMGVGATLADRVGKEALERDGKEAWMKAVVEATRMLREAIAADYVVLGGGNAALVDPLPKHVRRGGNEDAFTGGFRLWQEPVELPGKNSPPSWRIVF